MRNDPMEQKLKTAAEHLTPDVLDRILADCAKEPKGEILYMENISDPRSRNNNWIKVLSLGTAACMMIGGLFWWNRYRALNYTVEMDVNPSIELRVNKAEKVISAEALNKDAEIILEDMKLKGVDVDVATNAIIGSMVKNGYLSELSNSILLTVERAAVGGKVAYIEHGVAQKQCQHGQRADEAQLQGGLDQRKNVHERLLLSCAMGLFTHWAVRGPSAGAR